MIENSSQKDIKQITKIDVNSSSELNHILLEKNDLERIKKQLKIDIEELEKKKKFELENFDFSKLWEEPETSDNSTKLFLIVIGVISFITLIVSFFK